MRSVRPDPARVQHPSRAGMLTLEHAQLLRRRVLLSDFRNSRHLYHLVSSASILYTAFRSPLLGFDLERRSRERLIRLLASELIDLGKSAQAYYPYIWRCRFGISAPTVYWIRC